MNDVGADGNDDGAEGMTLILGNDGWGMGMTRGRGLLTMRAGSGTANFAREPAMSLEQAKLSISNGAEVADDLAKRGAHLVAGGDMGIGNTSSAAAICAAMTGTDPARVTGRGAGLDDAGLVRKVAVIRRGLELHKPDPADPVGVLSAVGGFEIGFLAGLMLGLAERRVAIALDGFIVTSAALIAHALHPRVVDYIFACHLSVEPGHRVALEHLNLHPLLDLKMGLGEGSGAALGMTIIDAAARLHAGMATFDEAAVSGRTDPHRHERDHRCHPIPHRRSGAQAASGPPAPPAGPSPGSPLWGWGSAARLRLSIGQRGSQCQACRPQRWPSPPVWFSPARCISTGLPTRSTVCWVETLRSGGSR